MISFLCAALLFVLYSLVLHFLVLHFQSTPAQPGVTLENTADCHCQVSSLSGHITVLRRCGLLVQTQLHGLLVCLLIGLSVYNNREPCKNDWTVDSGGPKELFDGGSDPHRRGTFEDGWPGSRRDFPACRHALFPVALMSGFPCMLSTSIPVGCQQTQSSVTLNFPMKNPQCDAASLTTCYC